MTRILNEEDIKKVCKKFCAEKSINELNVIVSSLQLRAETYMNHLSANNYINKGETTKYLNLTKIIEFINLHINTTIEKIKQDSIPKKEKKPINPSVVDIGDTVIVRNSYGDNDVFTLCEKKQNSNNMYEISKDTPIGKSLFERRIGDHITALIPSGVYEGDIIGIEKANEIVEVEEPKVLELC